eukprot:CAMPEP_0119320110 /NCGR_PEP_ID=MMETSP1333-20130426/51482_1 /TAXON_ID=418940 /ORGANISM="Scyphosphaera apsteinii, Strain RCC1455" /LENGTH=558 /DNA_ID=CAMNT_0007326739 /DNA_START=35 /DNA_END=1711 /DNA_ORIENTATION=-
MSGHAGDALSELERFTYQPSASTTAVQQQHKRQRTAEKAAVDAAELLAEAEKDLEQSQVDVAQVDVNSMKRMVLSVEKRINENMQMRMKYPDRPEKFMDSELELYQELKRLHVLATAPELFPTFVKTRCIPSLLGLLAHENSDISIDVVDLLHELTDVGEADTADSLALLDCLYENDVHTLLMQHMTRLNEGEEDDAAAMHATLSTIESLIELKPDVAVTVAQKGGLMKWLLNRLKPRAFHANKLFASELLAVLLQQNSDNQLFLGTVDGILSLLTAASQYKRREPQDMEEAELVENVFASMASALAEPANQHLFLKAEGIELMVLTIKERRYASHGALKVLNAALQGNGANCERFVDIRGFKTLFPMIGSQPPPLPPFAKGSGEKRTAQTQHDEHFTSVLCTLFAALSGERRQRLLGKFAEDNMAKLDKLLELHIAYSKRVTLAEEGVAEVHVDDDDDNYEEAVYLARMEAGSHTLQLVDVVLSHIATTKHKGLRQHVLQGLYHRSTSLHEVWSNADEYIKSLAASRVDATQKRQLDELSAAVETLLKKYQIAPAEE